MAKKVFKLNVKAQIDNMKSKGFFRKPAEESTMLFRIAPPVVEDPAIVFYRVRQHWGLVDEEGNNIALADLAVHGTDETGREDYVDEVAKAFLKLKGKNKMLYSIGDDLKGNNIYHAQGWEVFKQEDGTFKYDQELSFLSIPITASKAITAITERQAFMNEPTLDDAEKGQPVLLSRTGKGFDTEYSAERSGQVLPLDEAVPGWMEKLKDDVLDACNLKIYNREQQKMFVRLSYPDLDWDALEEEYGL